MKKLALLIFLLVLTSLACSFLTLAPTRVPDRGQDASPDSIAAAVTQTLDALATQSAASTPQPAATGLSTPWQPPNTATSAPTRPPTLAAGDRLQIVFVLSGDIYLWKPGGDQVRLTTHGRAVEVRLSPDGQWVAYTKKADEPRSEVWAIQADGRGDRPLITLADLPSPAAGQLLVPTQMEWLPASHNLLVASSSLQQEGPGTPQPYDLRSVNADSGEKKIILPAGQGAKFTLSPDKNKLLLTRSDRFLVADIDGQNLREVFTYPSVYTYSEWAYLPDVVWAADNRSFRVIIPPQDPMVRTTEQSIVWEIPVDGSRAKQIGAFLAAPAWRARPLLSGSATTAAYLTLKQPDDQAMTFHLLDLATGKDTPLNNNIMQVDNWSPDDIRLVVTVSDRVILEIISLGQPARTWPVGVRPYQLTWVDGKRFLVLSGSREMPELYLGSVDGPFVRLASAAAPQLSYNFIR